MSEIIDTTGSTLYIGPRATDDLATVKGTSPDPFEEVGDVQSIGQVTFAANEVRATALNRITDTVNKGVIPTPVLPIVFNKLAGDEGQSDMQDAFEDRTNNQFYWFKLVLPDAPSGGTPTTFYWKGKVMSFSPLNEMAVDGTVGGSTSLTVDYDSWTEEVAAEA